MKMKTLCFLGLPVLLIGGDQKVREETARRLDQSASVLTEIMQAKDKGIPEDLLGKAHCVVIVPGMKKGAFFVGGEYGKGFLSCRSKGDRWSAPGAVRLEGGSIGLQIGGTETDVIMLVMNDRGVDKLLSSQFTLGAEGEVAAGPLGRTASAETDAKMHAEILSWSRSRGVLTDAKMHAEILSWSRSRGVFAGIALKGATLRQDLDDNESLYSQRLENREIVTEGVTAPEPARKLLSVLNQYSPHQKS